MSAKSLEGQVALVTGAAKRIGRSIALELASEGAAVVVNYRHSQMEADETVSEIRSARARAIAVQADVSSSKQVEHLMDTV